MVTNFEKHWDKQGGKAYFTLGTMKDGLRKNGLVENSPTIFVNKNDVSHEVEACWTGRVRGFESWKDRHGRDSIRFEFALERAIDCPTVYRDRNAGWYRIDGPDSIIPETQEDTQFYPPFFERLTTTTSPAEFESYTLWLLKLLGIHQIHVYTDQSGRGDGFFRLASLAVIYDCTLRQNYAETKKDQINNYCGQLESGFLEYDGGTGTIDVRNCQKQVWIITKGSSKFIRKFDDVIVREKSIQDLVRAYRTRIAENLAEDRLVSLLANPY
jgi:hypothetical protein